MHTSSERTEKVNIQKQLITVFVKCLTETRRNEANLRFARISTMFQEVQQKLNLNGENRRFST